MLMICCCLLKQTPDDNLKKKVLSSCKLVLIGDVVLELTYPCHICTRLRYGAHAVEYVTEVKYLGLTVRERLNFSYHLQ